MCLKLESKNVHKGRQFTRVGSQQLYKKFFFQLVFKGTKNDIKYSVGVQTESPCKKIYSFIKN